MQIHQRSFQNQPSRHLFRSPLEVADTLKPDNPVHCFNPARLAQNCRMFLGEFGDNTAYAVKANPRPQVLHAAYNAGIKTLDVASLAEIADIAENFDDAVLHYHNPVKSHDEMATAYHQYGCKRFAIDDEQQLRLLAQIIGKDADLEVAVRFRLPAQQGAIHDFSSKFGATPQNAERLLRRVKLYGYKPVLTFHPGSQCTDARLWGIHIRSAAIITHNAKVELHRLNIGGGFPASYAQSEPGKISQMFEIIKKAATAHFGKSGHGLLECEPGRAIVASSLSTLAKVKMVRGSTAELFLNDGIYGNLLEMAQAPALTPHVKIIRNGKYYESTESQPFTVYGPTCDPLDRLPGLLQLPCDITQGDYLQFCNLGAYGGATATQFNGYGSSDLVFVEQP